MTAATFGERFLSGEPPRERGGMEIGSPGELAGAVALPGGSHHLHGLSAAQVEALARRFGERWGSPLGAAAVEVRVHRAPPEVFRTVDTRGWEYALDFDFTADRVHLAGLGLYADLHLPPAPQQGLRAGLWVDSSAPAAFPGAAENLLRVATAYRLLAVGGVLVHAAGVACDGLALAAVGRSGAGKSTFARAAAEDGATVLSDDLVALLPGPKGEHGATAPPRLAALPFTGDLPAAPGAPEAPCAVVLRLEQAPADTLRPLGPGEALATLIACAPSVNADPHRRETLLATLSALLAALPAGACRALGCTAAGGWPLAASLLREAERS
jgi:hypothetical protein